MTNTLDVLYVEDCEVTAELLRLYIKRYYPDTNIEFDVVSTVSEAIEFFATDNHIAALIDWNLPDGEGTEVAQHIRQLHKTIPIIFLSAAFTNEHLRAAEQYDPRDCLVKDSSRIFIENIVQHITNGVR